jgi:hypothetical protein
VTKDATADLLPVLLDHQERVEEAMHAVVPNRVAKRSSFSNWDGWAAGVVAADLAELNVRERLKEREAGRD